MRKVKKLLPLSITLVSLFISLNLFAKAKIENVLLDKSDSTRAIITIKYSGDFNGTPDLFVRNNIVQIAIPDSVVWPKIEKKVSISGSPLDSTILAYQFDKNLTRVRAILPYSLKGLDSKVSVTLKKNSIELYFPIKKVVASKKIAKTKKINGKRKSKVTRKEIAKYDEAYLNKLLANSTDKKVIKEDKVSEDKVKLAVSSIKKETGSVENVVKKTDFSMMKYIGKFAGFLMLVLFIFYGLVNLFKKGVLKKGKLGFLNNMNSVTVLNTTYLGPKKSIVMIKAHKQVFLIGTSEKGMHFLSEVKDPTGVLKDGECTIGGSNFDTNLETAEDEKKDFKLKEVAVSAEVDDESPLSEFLGTDAPVIDKVKLSDQIKNRVKNLKSLQ